MAGITVVREGNLLVDSSVNYYAKNESAFSPGDDGAQNGTLTFAPGESIKTISVPIVDDQFADGGDEQFAVHRALHRRLPLIPRTSAVVIIYNDIAIRFMAYGDVPVWKIAARSLCGLRFKAVTDP